MDPMTQSYASKFYGEDQPYRHLPRAWIQSRHTKYMMPFKPRYRELHARAIRELITLMWTNFSFEFWYNLGAEERFEMCKVLDYGLLSLQYSILEWQDWRIKGEFFQDFPRYQAIYGGILESCEKLWCYANDFRAAFNKGQFVCRLGELFNIESWFQGPEDPTPEILQIMRMCLKQIFDELGELEGILRLMLVYLLPYCLEIFGG